MEGIHPVNIPTPRLSRGISAIAIAIAVTLPAAAVATGSFDRTRAVRNAIEGGHARNVILLIGDGMGDSEITIARDYTVGAGGKLNIDKFPLTGQMTTYSVLESNPSTPDYTSESASTATAWSTGHKTADGRISTSAGTDKDLKTILELAKSHGYKTGNVTTAELTDATPAAPMSHVNSRGCQGPLNMAACPQDRKSVGGKGSISEQGVDLRVDVLLGGGKARFDQVIPVGEPNAGQTVLQTATAQGYAFVGDRAGLLAALPGKKLLGLFTSGNMSLEWSGPTAAHPPVGPVRCTEDLRPANEPSLDDMTRKALQLLGGNSSGHGRGFFLQVESASIDKQDHISEACEQIGETVNFDRAVRVALDYAKKHSDTLVIITGDHAHTSQIIETDATPAGFGIILETDEGGLMQVSYGTGSTPTGHGHTGSQIRVAALGPQAANVVGLIDQTDLFDIMARALNVD
jgi:alkaline phosphatase